jgi:hypothetical protein
MEHGQKKSLIFLWPPLFFFLLLFLFIFFLSFLEATRASSANSFVLHKKQKQNQQGEPSS